MWTLVLSFWAAVTLAAPPVEDGRATPRVVSLNVCTDQLLIALADREQIAAVSYLAVEPSMSAYAKEAQGLRLVRGNAEEVMALEPDLVLAGTFSTRQTVRLLERLGYQVMEFTPATDIEGIKTNLRDLGATLGRQDEAEALIAEMESRLAAAQATLADTDETPLFATYEANGWSTGGGTLMADIATRAGFRTLGDDLGFMGTRKVSLETLLVASPDVLDLGDVHARSRALAEEALRHPALTAMLKTTARTELPGNLTTCGTPKTVTAVERLTAAHARLPQEEVTP